MKTESQKRNAATGLYTKHTRCDGCGGAIKGDYLTDDEVCNGGDGPGFYICERVHCSTKLAAMSVEQRRTHYTAQRRSNVT